MFDKNFNLICGHYGCGKTNLALNIAEMKAKEGRRVTLVDLDLVNPYFRSSDYAERLKSRNIRVIAPVYANSNVDIPSLPAEINGIFDTEDLVILDVGGDDVGATVLGRFSSRIAALDYDMYYVINRYRNLTATAEDAVNVLKEIEAVSHLKATGLVNNSHLKAETTAQTLLDSVNFAESVARLSGLKLAGFTAPRGLEKEVEPHLSCPVWPVDIIVRTEWEMQG